MPVTTEGSGCECVVRPADIVCKQAMRPSPNKEWKIGLKDKSVIDRGRERGREGGRDKKKNEGRYREGERGERERGGGGEGEREEDKGWSEEPSFFPLPLTEASVW